MEMRQKTGRCHSQKCDAATLRVKLQEPEERSRDGAPDTRNFIPGASDTKPQKDCDSTNARKNLRLFFWRPEKPPDNWDGYRVRQQSKSAKHDAIENARHNDALPNCKSAVTS